MLKVNFFFRMLVIVFLSTGYLDTCEEAFARETRNITGVGNLDSNAPISSSVLSLSGSTFVDLENASQYRQTLVVWDTTGNKHTLYLYYFRLDTSLWEIRSYVDGVDIGKTAGIPELLSRFSVSFFPDGTREAVPPVDAIAVPVWAVTGEKATLRIKYPKLTQFAAASDISLFQDGCLTGCGQSAGNDFDGDMIDDLFIWRPDDGYWAIKKSGTPAEVFYKQWGLPGDFPMSGNYTADNIADLVVWRPSNGTWYINTSESFFTSGMARQWGLPGDRPLKGDFDGDGILDLAVWRPGDFKIYYISSRTGQAHIEQFGLPGDIPGGAGIDR